MSGDAPIWGRILLLRVFQVTPVPGLRESAREGECADFSDILQGKIKSGDFIFLDPPYMPVGKWADFKRYTKEQFGIADQRRLSDAIARLRGNDIWAVLTNSNHPLVRELYSEYPIEIVQTRRNISSDGEARHGEDAIVDIRPDKFAIGKHYLKPRMPDQARLYPQQ